MGQRQKLRVRRATIGGIRIQESIDKTRVHEERRRRRRVAENVRDSRLRIREILGL